MMMRDWKTWMAAAVVGTAGLLGPTARGEAPPATGNPNPARYLFEDALRPGMSGYGLTVMHGGKIEKFQVEIIDVVKNMSPGMNAIMVRCSGLNLEHTGIIAGMSGSPVFIDNKMIGAIAFGWEGSKDPIGGVQPIRQMLGIPIPAAQPPTAPGVPAARGTSRWGAPDGALLKSYALGRPGWARLMARLSGPNPEAAGGSRAWQADKRTAGMRPLAAPLMVSATSDAGMAFLQAAFKGSGLVPVASGSLGGSLSGTDTLGGAAQLKPDEIKLEPGSSIAIPLLTGDTDMSAIGTVTEIYNGRVYAFGHAMDAEGPTHLPIATGYIYTVMPTLQDSFKMGASLRLAGALVTDEQTGIVGQIGLQPDYVPLTISVRSADGLQNREYHYQLVEHPKYTPELLGAGILQSLTAQQKFPKEFTAHLTGEFQFDGATLRLDSRATNDNFNPAEAVLPVGIMLDNPWQTLRLKAINLQAQVELRDNSATITSVRVDQTTVAPGQEIHAVVELEPRHQPVRQVALLVRVPEDAPDGDYELTIGSPDMALEREVENFPQRFAPENVHDLRRDMQHILDYRNDRIYASLILDPHGVAQHGREFPNMPRTRLAMFATDKRGDALPVCNAVTTDVAADAVVLSGGQTFSITVDRAANRRFFTPKGQRAAPAGKPRGTPLIPASASGPATQTQPQP